MRTAKQALAFCEQQTRALTWAGARDNIGKCLYNAQEEYGAPHLYYDAAEQWRETVKHPDANPPVGAPVFWLGGSSGHGHVAIADGQGYCWSVDFPRGGSFSRVPLIWPSALWGLAYVGWGSEIGGRSIDFDTDAGSSIPNLPTIPTTPKPSTPSEFPGKTPTTSEEDDGMKPRIITVYGPNPASGSDDGLALLEAGGVHMLLSTADVKLAQRYIDLANNPGDKQLNRQDIKPLNDILARRGI